MTTAIVLSYLSWALMVLGSGFIVIGGIGAIRLPNFYTRMHAASLTDSMGSILILLGLMLQSGLTLVTVKLLAILVFLLLTGPTATYSMANAAFLSGMHPNSKDVEKTNN